MQPAIEPIYAEQYQVRYMISVKSKNDYWKFTHWCLTWLLGPAAALSDAGIGRAATGAIAATAKMNKTESLNWTILDKEA